MRKKKFKMILFCVTVMCLISLSLSWSPQRLGFQPMRRVLNPFKSQQLSNLLLKATATSTVLVDKGSIPPYTLSVPQKIYVFLTSFFLTCLLIADVIGVKIFELKLPFSILGFKAVEQSCGMLTFPFTFLISDIITEYYGPETTTNTVFIGLYMSIFAFFIMNAAQALPYLDKPFNVTPFAFNSIFGSAKLLFIASLIAYLVGQFMDIWLFGLIKKWTKGKYLWLRSAGSTLISQMFDSIVVTYFVFSVGKTLTGQIPATLNDVINISVTGYGLKFVATVLVTPLLYVMKLIMEKKFGLRPIPSNSSDGSEK